MATLNETPRKDKRVINLATDIANAKDRKIPILLLELKDILSSAEAGSEDAKRIRQELYSFNVLQVLILVIRQDFSIIDGEWRTAATLAKILSQTCTGVSLKKEDSSGFYDDLLPKACENLFLLARHIQAHYTSIPEDELTEAEEAKIVENFQTVMDALAYIVAGHIQLSKNVWTSPWLLQLLISDEPDTVVSVMTLLLKVLRFDGYILNKLNDSTVYSVMDELIYKLTVNNIIEVAGVATKCVLRVCDYHRGMVGALSTRYKGLRPLLRKWSGQGFDRDLKHLLTILETGSVHKAESEKFMDAAMVIQMMWRGFATRKRLKKANEAFAKFQKKYRLKKRHVTMKKEEMKLADEFNRQLKENRIRIMREFHERQLQTIEILPAAKVEQYLAKEKSVAAIRIQKLWRGKKERDLLPQRLDVQRQVKAAIKIQRHVRKWLDRRCEDHKDIPISLKPPGLTEARRMEIQQEILDWRESHPTSVKDLASLQQMYEKTGQMLNLYYGNLRAAKKREQHIDALIKRLDTDSELMLLAPKLEEVTDKDVDMYLSHSVPVATKARLNHLERLRRLQAPWWKKLDEEDSDSDGEKSKYLDEDEVFF